MQEVHTCILRVVPPPAGVRTVWMLGFQRRLVRRCEWDTLWPKPGPLPQTSHTLATGISWIVRDWSPADAVRATWPEYPMGPAATESGTGRHGCRTPALGFPDVRDTLDAAVVRRWCATGLDRLRGHQH